ncbi:branched-chain amino acid ABC transporter permease [Achromobacter kerstersii]|uniref:Branched-chain amino acid ABC transporter permease n=1 Tax=Achromobacter kerstersii TaxID=1353890 RepID=A0A6S6Z6Q7_9BURK|nr:branched-chain amino acid ABC transporter permease [Achromobacter kerstersii]CAB3664790.1 hypothetical protein LMG3441_00755 [Achromobacter kerstersii]
MQAASIPAATPTATPLLSVSGATSHSLSAAVTAPLLLGLLLLPIAAHFYGQEYFLSPITRVLIYAMAASSLNLILGFGGMVSFGHAAFMGVGAYAAAAMMMNNVSSLWVALPVAMGLGAAVSSVIGVISLRAQGVYFIMITLAFAQMLYYVAISLKFLGGEDGLPLSSRGSMWPVMEPLDDTALYYVAVLMLAAVVIFVQRLVNANFGHILEAIRINETRVASLGVSTFRHKLIAFVIAGALAGLSGALLAHQSGFVSPSLMHWTQSGVLMVMVILGGAGHLYGGIIGAVIYGVLEEGLSGYTEHWQLAMGVVLLVAVLVAPQGISRRVLKRASK